LITELSEEFGAQAVVLAIDARRTASGGWNVYTRGGRDDEGMMQSNGLAVAKNGRGRNPAHFHGYRWRPDRLRLSSHAHGAPGHAHPRDCVRRHGKPEDFLDVLQDADAALAASIFHYGT
jgi:cyclase